MYLSASIAYFVLIIYLLMKIMAIVLPSVLTVLVIFYEIGVFLSNDGYLAALPALARDFGVTTEYAQFTISAWFAGSSTTQLIIGPFSDKYGRKPVLMFGAILFAISSAICAITPDLNTFLVGRFLQGVCVAPIFVAGYAAVHESFSSKKAVQMLAIITSITLLAPAIGPLFGAIIVKFAHWRWILWILAIWGCISVVLCIFMKESLKKPCEMNFNQIVKSYGRIVSNREFISYQFLFAFFLGGFFMWLTDSPLILIEKAGWGEIGFGISQLLIFSGYIMGNQWTKRSIDKMSVQSIINRGILIAGLSTLMLCVFYMIGGGFYYKGVVISMFFLSVGAASLSAPLNRLAIDSSNEPTGKKTAIFSLGISILAMVSSFLIGMIDADLPWFLVVNYVIIFLIFLSLPKNIKFKDEEENI